MSEVKLKPCPFCGGEATSWKSVILDGWNVSCGKCDALVYEKTIEKAIAKWNQRHEPPTPGGAIVPAGNERLAK